MSRHGQGMAGSGVPDEGRRSYDFEFRGLRVHRVVFPVAVAIIVLAVIAALSNPGAFNAQVARIQQAILRYADSFIMIMGNLFVLLCVAIAVSPLGRIRLGGPGAKPAYGFVSWFSMMFAAGMGVGLLYWGVAEPVAAYTGWSGTPLGVEPRTVAAAHVAMGSVLFHWGLHPWAVYLATAMVVGYFAYNRDEPFAMSSALSPLIGRHSRGPLGQAVDVFAVVVTTFGLATSLGLGAMQSAAGMNLVLGIPASILTQCLFIVMVCLVASYSVWTGIDSGILYLSNLNMLLAVLLLAFCAVGMGIGNYFVGIGEAFVDYMRNILPLSDWHGRTDADWYHGWTVFYWAWWCSWGPLVGVFIARVSRGRTLRQMVAVVMVTPALFTLLWFGAFGRGAIDQVAAGRGALADGLQDVNMAIFQYLGSLPLAGVTTVLVIVLLVIFTVTSVDSGALVADNMAANGRTDTQPLQRVLWVFLIGLVATTLMVLGGEAGLKALQSFTIVAALPFLVLMLVLITGLAKALLGELRNG